jgi:hypothetical protein
MSDQTWTIRRASLSRRVVSAASGFIQTSGSSFVDTEIDFDRRSGDDFCDTEPFPFDPADRGAANQQCFVQDRPAAT